ncbi:ribosome-associated heat shock protein Hsp15 [Aliikangiella sp. IMCC44359]|uniref:ribosome-associated heat shock protein Hsp15 n=1 Tax=Aliikangiella sp. IMCC44359 TaxID=3459125 RepID=UPI00403AA90F
MSQDTKIRLDKWLWACRFYKTRAIAKAAIEGGKVHYEGQKPKPGKAIQIGETIKLRQGFDEKIVIIKQLSEHRGPAKIAQTLYEETSESIAKREEITLLRKMSAPTTTGKPDKKQRRAIHRFKNIHDYDPTSEGS